MTNVIRRTRERLRRLIDFALSSGWTVSRTAGGHVRFTKTGMPPIFTSFTSSDHRAELNARARLRRADRRQISLTGRG